MHRRRVLKLISAGMTALAIAPGRVLASRPDGVLKQIPATGERIPVIGMGTWRTFNVGTDTALRNARTEVLKAFFEEGGGMIDSSPMYGSAQAVLGYGFERIGHPESLFSADKVWTRDGNATRSGTAEVARLWGVQTLDLMQVHNLLSWEAHLENLEALKAEGKVRYIGITTSHGRRHRDFEQIMRTRKLDFVQLTYNLTHRQVEQRLLPLAAERGIAVIANRPYDGGNLVRRLKNANAPLPDWAAEFDCRNWPEFLLKFIVSHPALTCAIPATTRVEHLRENMGAGRGQLPDERTRKKMVEYVADL